MDVAEFDRFADEYHNLHSNNIRITGEAPEYFARFKVVETAKRTRELGRTVENILDFGSGIGNSVPFFREVFANAQLSGADVSERSLGIAEARFPGQSTPLVITDDHLPARSDTFDLAFSACVFHHIAHADHGRWLAELYRVTKPGGMLTVFEHNPLNPLTVRAVNTCPFDENARLMTAGTLKRRFVDAGWRHAKVRYHLFFPRALAALRALDDRLGWIPFGAQYSITAIKP